MEEYLYTLAAFLFFSTTGYAAYANPLLVIDADPTNPLPKNFRVMDKKGMKIIGSGQFTKTQLIAIKNKINDPIIIVDLRQESHGFINDFPISWYGVKNWENKHKSMLKIKSQQNHLLTNLSLQTNISVYKIIAKNSDGKIEEARPLELKPEQVYSEQQLAKEQGLGYKHFYIADHSPPSLAQIYAFKKFIKTVPQNTWLYFHCRGGVGRTSTFMTLYDIMKNGKNESLADILQYQIQLGGKDLTQLPAPTNYKYDLAKQRMALIKQYYESITSQ